MKTNKAIAVFACTAFSAPAVSAGGLDNLFFSVDPIFREGNYLEISGYFANFSMSGTDAFNVSTGDIMQENSGFGFAYLHQFSDTFSMAAIKSDPYFASSDFEAGTFLGTAGGWESNSLALIGRYRIDDSNSVFGGLRAVNSDSNASLAQALFPGGYSASTDSQTDVGYVLGYAFEKPEIGLKIVLTYESAVKQSFNLTEDSFLGSNTSNINVTLPQAVSLELQTGLNETTVIYGGVRWSDWTAFEVDAPDYRAATGQSLASFDDDVFTYSLGVGHQINERWGVFGEAYYEQEENVVLSPLAPSDGQLTVGLGAVYDAGSTEITAVVYHVMLGGGVDAAGTTFDDGSATVLGLSVGWSF